MMINHANQLARQHECVSWLTEPPEFPLERGESFFLNLLEEAKIDFW